MNIPVPDSPNFESVEALVELYFQLMGYITSSGKWFRVWDQESNKRQQGDQDIDILAINGSETVIVSVTTNLDDKIKSPRLPSGEEFNKKLFQFYERSEGYLRGVDEYKWLFKKPRKVVRCLAFARAYKNERVGAECEAIKYLSQNGIRIVSPFDVYSKLSEGKNSDKEQRSKVQNHLMRAIFLLQAWEKTHTEYDYSNSGLSL